MTRSPKRAVTRWLPLVRRMLYLAGLSNVADALGVENPPPDMAEFADATARQIDRLSHTPEFAALGEADREGAEDAFGQVVAGASPISVWQGVLDGPEGVVARLLTPDIVTRRRDLGSANSQAYFDRLVDEVAASLCRWVEDRPFDTTSLVVGAARALGDQNAETHRLLGDLRSLVNPPEDPHTREVSRQRLRTQAKATRALLEPDVLPSRRRLADVSPTDIGTDMVPFPVVITGDGGQGKSVFLGQVHDAQGSARDIILILASQVPAGADIGTPDALDKALGEAAYGLPSAPALSHLLLATFQEQRPVVILDTVDLLLSDSTADAIVQLFTRLADLCDLVATCRTREWEDLMTGAPRSWTQVRVEGLHPDQIVEWTQGYLATTTLSDEVAQQFVASVSTVALDHRVRDVLAVPLRLAMACRLYARSGALPIDLSVTQLYAAYWASRVARDRRGRRGQAAAQQEVSALALAGDLWSISARRFSETFAADPATIHVCRALESEGILKTVGARYAFFHQTFAEFAVARYLATHGTDDDWATLAVALIDGSAAHWGTAMHLVVDSMDFERFSVVATHIPTDTPLGVRLILRGLFARAPSEAGTTFRQLAEEVPAGVVGASDLLETAPTPWVPLVLDVASSWLAKPERRDGRLVNAVAALILRSDSSSRSEALRAAMTSLLSASSSDLAAQARRLVHGVLRPRDDYDPLPPLRAFPLYAALSGPARAEVLEAQSELHDPDDDVEFMTIALAHDCPNGAVDHAASLLLRSWRDPSGRERLGWSDWRVLLNTKYRALWDAAQVRAVAALASDETSVLGEVVAAALSRGDVDRDRIHNVVHFLAEQQPQLVARTTLSLPAAALREAAGTFAVLTRTVAPSIGRTDRYALIERLKAYAPHDPRRVWPAIARSALSEPSLVASVLDEIAGTQEGPVRRSTFDACLSELDFNGRVQHRDRLRALVRTAEPRDRERRARLDGYLAMADATARANVLALMGAAPAAREPLAAAGALEKVLATWSKPLDAEASAWLLDILCSQHEHVVRTIAQCLARRITIFAWDSIAIARVLERHGQSLAWHEDAQVAAALKAIFTSLFHCDEPLLRELVRADLVHVNAGRKLTPFRRLKTDPLVVMVPRLTTLARGRGRGL